jgi:hypothetical protein
MRTYLPSLISVFFVSILVYGSETSGVTVSEKTIACECECHLEGDAGGVLANFHKKLGNIPGLFSGVYDIQVNPPATCESWNTRECRGMSVAKGNTTGRFAECRNAQTAETTVCPEEDLK